MHELYELKEKLMKELNEYASQEMSAGSLEVIDKLTHAIKNICKIIEAAEEEEYSGRGQGGGNYSRNYRYSREGMGGGRYAYEGGQGGGGSRYSREGGSYARGRGGNARRDSMGRYSSEGGYSRADGLDGLVEDIRSMMQELPQGVQQDAQRFVQKLEQQM
ncbi:MAG: hypothetical protein J6Y48_16985 [Clostridia bacterium]|nr:hypothetical protein [Clostridia bacterium]